MYIYILLLAAFSHKLLYNQKEKKDKHAIIWTLAHHLKKKKKKKIKRTQAPFLFQNSAKPS